MLLLIKLAWRNIFRNTRRTLLAGLAIGIGLASLIFTDAVIIGMEESMIRTATDTFLGQGQIHFEGFRSTFEVEKTINNLKGVLSNLQDEREIRSFSVRTQAFSMLTSPMNVGSITLYGIDPQLEREVSKIDEAIAHGAYLKPDDRGRILMGTKLAETLEVGLGDRVVVTVAQAETGALAQEMFRVAGIFHFNSREMDGGVAFINLEKARELLNLDEGAHEIALHFDDLDRAGDRSLDFWRRYSQNGNEALGWKDLMPELDAAVQLSQFSTLMVAFVLFSVVALGIMNTLFMSLYERMFEFGVLRAVGTRPFRMALTILFEAGALAIISIIIGIAIGYAATYYVSVRGIDYVGIEFGGVTLRELIYPVMHFNQFTLFPLYVFTFTLIAGIYPALFAAKLAPAKAMRRSF